MKITIDIPQLDNLVALNTEIGAIDTELSELVKALADIQQTNNAGSQPSLAKQLSALLDRARNVSDDNSRDNLNRHIETYAHGYSQEVIDRLLAPHRRVIAQKINELGHKANNALNISGSTGHIRARNDIINNYNPDIVTDIEAKVKQAIEAEFDKHMGTIEKEGV